MRGGAGKPNQMDENTNNVGQRIRNSKQHWGGGICHEIEI